MRAGNSRGSTDNAHARARANRRQREKLRGPKTGTCLLLVVIVVGRSQEMAEDELGHVHVLLAVHGDGDALAVVPHADAVCARAI